MTDPKDPKKKFSNKFMSKSPLIPPAQQKDNIAVKGRTMLDLRNVKIARNANAKGTPNSIENILVNSDKAAKKKANTMSEYDYYNPKVEEGITSGDWKQDFLYNNQYLMDVPVVGGFIKDKIKDMAGQTGGSQAMEVSDIENIQVEAKKLADDRKKGLNPFDYNTYTGADKARNPNETPGVNLLDQYFSEKPLLQPAKYKPKDGYYPFLKTYSARAKNWEDNVDTTDPTIEGYRSPRENVNKQIQSVLNEGFFDSKMNEKIEGYNSNMNTSKLMWDSFMKDKKTIYTRRNNASPVSNAMNVDLGGHSIGIGYDDEAGYPYMSVADAWDFEPEGYTKKWGDSYGDEMEGKRQLAKIQSSLMHKAGNPYKLYDRFYINPGTGKYMTTAEMKALQKNKKKNK
jgi:hypothetical protein|tara:strand:- start:692 stop:1888 length:1197 start_codon:yes stop_codon:yes gene_type:complete